jgi:hypothetical protein
MIAFKQEQKIPVPVDRLDCSRNRAAGVGPRGRALRPHGASTRVSMGEAEEGER